MDKWHIERQLVREIYHYNKGRYGYRRITAEQHKYISYYNSKRIKSRLGWTSPIQYRKAYEQSIAHV